MDFGISYYDIKHDQHKVNVCLTNAARSFNNTLYILSAGNHCEIDDESRHSLKALKDRIEDILTNY